ncbi:7-cyano-7-deazaguanine synthase QueC [Streptomyces sp. ISL-1]|uniref:7-cyano-7-deazaguanine synthase QueC n=1 Tax=Streptomyces sp. ISL-1 TaxID=2817657 RepID=UPI001BE88977|nr:7-cyano-7-deazaguanine synthase QueC [Streptomyces sp. ISL-1]MBT2388638.1 7-cyano-7-deazaguanine synthase QueC [Streptomyces sp. ISL-1]
MKVVVLLSGGLDSTVLAAQFVEGGHVVLGLSANYGQRHVRELDAAAAVSDALSIRHNIVDLRGVTAAMDPASSVLLSSTAMPHGQYSHESMAATVVPGRNLLFIAAAAAVAASRQYDAVALGAHAGDHPVYPDCRPDFLVAAAGAVERGTGVELLFPFAETDKTGIVALGARLGAPLDLTWSCYDGGDVHCGRCGTCVERAEAFSLAGIPDPTAYGV